MVSRVNAISPPQIVYGTPLIRYLDTVGDGTGIKQATDNYALNPTAFYLKPPVGIVYVVNLFIIHLTDTGAFNDSDYGSINGGLPNGILITAGRNGVDTLDILDGLPIQSNRHFTRLTSSVQLINWDGNSSSLQCSYKASDFGTNLILDGTEGDYIKVLCRDDLTGLTGHRFGAFGIIET